jgi:two-component system KDP operon response regulator KdpE
MGKTILVVDDEQDLLDLMEIILGAEGFDIITASNGQEAINKIKDQIPDLVLLDVMMPIMDGWQTLKNIKSTKETMHIPVVMVTAKIGDDDRARGFREGASDYIGKPFAPKEVVNRVKVLLK